MKIVIDIPEEDYNFVRKQVADGITNPLKVCIANGTPLPKEHGRLVDATAYQTKLEEKVKRLNNLDTINGLCGAVALLSDTDTIIEADKGE